MILLQIFRDVASCLPSVGPSHDSLEASVRRLQNRSNRSRFVMRCIAYVSLANIISGGETIDTHTHPRPC